MFAVEPSDEFIGCMTAGCTLTELEKRPYEDIRNGDCHDAVNDGLGVRH